MNERERRLSEENAVFEETRDTPAKPAGRPETATEEVERKESALPHGGKAPEYEEADRRERKDAGST